MKELTDIEELSLEIGRSMRTSCNNQLLRYHAEGPRSFRGDHGGLPDVLWEQIDGELRIRLSERHRRWVFPDCTCYTCKPKEEN